MVWENAHPLVRQSMDKISHSDEEVGNSYKEQGVIAGNPPRVPDQKKNAPCHSDGEKFSQSVEQQKIVSAYHKKPHKDHQTKTYLLGCFNFLF
ncbi:hypothetical protein JCM14469_18740 [Desulfatiferula olefinivorans]